MFINHFDRSWEFWYVDKLRLRFIAYVTCRTMKNARKCFQHKAEKEKRGRVGVSALHVLSASGKCFSRTSREVLQSLFLQANV
ncbi:hypothetical protein COCMIDRAFT_85852 [Bipolaris oryzae ATCC 44560]|uniref:Uncharacterized protein n=1 Tax=Bipolaris oryzae ATCC 44560 TaxID=930090 RepID=W6ZN60_COCMI|nr:uncharacterized protein COCMIDRAFT_85852 [Bipolaris oryzae ATCC 44560]EUC48939.1 hypothetical protein COCMIDRAFT_85852 [Bipolaris oryzae ATCC 44560]